MRIVKERVSGERMHIEKVNWIIANNYGKPEWHSFMPSLSWKGEILGFNIVSQMCPQKQTTCTEPKLLILVSFFSG